MFLLHLVVTRGWLIHFHVGVYVCYRLLQAVTLADLSEHLLDVDCSAVLKWYISVNLKLRVTSCILIIFSALTYIYLFYN